MFYEKKEENRLRCLLCPHKCIIGQNKKGVCGVRKNIGGDLFSLIYGKASSINVDPIEKKPLYHFLPGTGALSLGTIGCNFKCDFCQNSSISQADFESFSLREIKPEEVVSLARRTDCQSIAWTYNEPTIWYEFTYRTSKLAKMKDLRTLYVTNGFIDEAPLRKIAPYLDAMNIDVKSFNNDFYRKIAGGSLDPVLSTCITAKALGIHIELTYLVIPGVNDDLSEIEDYLIWVKSKLGPDIPLHFSAFHPDYKMRDRSRTSKSKLKKIYSLAERIGHNYIYLGNVLSRTGRDTRCPDCGKIVIKRSYMGMEKNKLVQKKCPSCSKRISIR